MLYPLAEEVDGQRDRRGVAERSARRSSGQDRGDVRQSRRGAAPAARCDRSREGVKARSSRSSTRCSRSSSAPRSCRRRRQRDHDDLQAALPARRSSSRDRRARRVDVWLFFLHGVAQPLRQHAYNPRFCCSCSGRRVAAASTSRPRDRLRYGGAEAGGMGAGIYIVWPAFYTDVTDAYRLGHVGSAADRPRRRLLQRHLRPRDRRRATRLTGFEPLLLCILLQHSRSPAVPAVPAAGRLLHRQRPDGRPGHVPPDQADAAEPAPVAGAERGSDRAEAVGSRRVTPYVLTSCRCSCSCSGCWSSTHRAFQRPPGTRSSCSSDKVQHAFDGGSSLNGAIGIFQIADPGLPHSGISATFWMVAQAILRRCLGTDRWHPAARGGLVLASAAAAAFLAATSGGRTATTARSSRARRGRSRAQLSSSLRCQRGGPR